MMSSEAVYRELMDHLKVGGYPVDGSWVTTGAAEKAFGLPYRSPYLARWVKAGNVTAAGITASGRYMWDLEDLARQFAANTQRARERTAATA
jgi:hypothetical protein